MTTMLSEALQEFTGLLNQLLRNLLGNDAGTWQQEFKRFLRQEPCWTKPEPKKLPLPLPSWAVAEGSTTEENYEVVCVTKRSMTGRGFDKPHEWHLPTTGIVKVVTRTRKHFGLTYSTEIVAAWNGEEHKIHYVRSGLDSASRVIAIERKDAEGVLELYTDTPTGEYDSTYPLKTQAEIRQLAKEAIRKANLRRAGIE